MHNFNFYNPTRIEFGIDKEDTLADHIAKDGIHHVLICYGTSESKMRVCSRRSRAVSYPRE